MAIEAIETSSLGDTEADPGLIQDAYLNALVHKIMISLSRVNMMVNQLAEAIRDCERSDSEDEGDAKEAQTVQPTAKVKAQNQQWTPKEPAEAPPLTMLLQKHMQKNTSQAAGPKRTASTSTPSHNKMPPTPPSPPWKKSKQEM